MSNRFHVALSFPGEHRDFVLEVANSLAAQLTRDRVFYDAWYEVELLGTGGDLKLQAMYEQADLVVPFFSKHYSKSWCSMEWETIRGILLNRRKDDAVIPVHLDDTNVPGWAKVNFGIQLQNRSAQQIAGIIIKALARRVPDVLRMSELADVEARDFALGEGKQAIRTSSLHPSQQEPVGYKPVKLTSEWVSDIDLIRQLGNCLGRPLEQISEDRFEQHIQAQYAWDSANQNRITRDAYSLAEDGTVSGLFLQPVTSVILVDFPLQQLRQVKHLYLYRINLQRVLPLSW